MTIAVAVSGGADSLYAMASLQREYPGQVIAFHALQKETLPEDDPVPGLEASCRALGVPLHILDLQEAFFRQIVRPFAESYAHGETPNPCVRCNALVKFGLWMDEARKLGADRLATGHYVSLAEHPRYGMALHQGADEAKDQSYFLALTPISRLKNAVFPLARVRKGEVRAALVEWGLSVPLPRESQEICFVPDDDYRAFLKGIGVRLPAGGPMVLLDGHVVGRHGGLWQYTEGQRRGLGVSWTEPLYVIGKDRSRNALLLGTADELPVNACAAGELNFLVPRNCGLTSCGCAPGIARRRFRRTSVWWAAARAAWTPLPGCLSVSISRSSPPPLVSSPLFSTSTGMCSLGESFVRSVKAEDEEAGRGGEAARRKFLSRSGVKQKNGLLENTSKPSLFSVKPERGIR